MPRKKQKKKPKVLQTKVIEVDEEEKIAIGIPKIDLVFPCGSPDSAQLESNEEQPSSDDSNKSKQVKRFKQQQNNYKVSDEDSAYEADSELDLHLHLNDAGSECESMVVENDDQQETADSMEEGEIEDDSDTNKGYTKIYSRKMPDKENVTPPKDHSTPSRNKKAQKLDDSLFGFNDIDSSLTFSPVTLQPPSPASTCTSIVSTSPTKRKVPGYGMFDIPIEMPQKRQKKKKKSAKDQGEKADHLLEALREQFREVEMHELLVEYSK